MSNIHFFCEEIDFSLKNKTTIIKWIEQIVASESSDTISNINFIFCSDSYLEKINIEHLKHHTLTDIITFDYSENEKYLEADIFISIDRVRENGSLYHSTFNNELHRIMIHGILHLLGYSDKNPTEKEVMRKKENECLNLLNKNVPRGT